MRSEGGHVDPCALSDLKPEGPLQCFTEPHAVNPSGPVAPHSSLLDPDLQ